jgi:putative DNA primase/helicase
MRVVKKTLKNSFRRNRLAEVIADIKASTIKEIPETPTHLIAVQNGILNLKTMKLESFSSDYFILNPLPVKYDPKANCPKIKKFVSEIVPPENVLVLQEASGYCLHRDIPIHRTFLFLGEGANGKSTFMELLRTFLGKGNVCSIPLQDFEKDKFATAQLYGKLANIYPDLSVEDLKNTGVFKTTSGGDTISAQFKFKDMFDFKPYAKQLYSANKPPKTFDQSYAFWRRWITVNFPNQFRDDDPKTDKNLLQKLTTPEELSGFLNWALEGLRRLLENAKFSTTMSEEETQEQWTAAVDVIKAFIEEGYLEWCSGEFTTKDECYEEFLAFCQRNKLPRECERVFKNRITKEFPMCKEMQKNVGNRILRGWADLKLNKFNSKNRINTWSTTATDLRENYNSNRQPVEAVSPVETHSTGKTLEDFKDVAKS